MVYNVTCNTDDNYAQHCCATLCSLFENNKDKNFHVHILTHGLSEMYSSQIESLAGKYDNTITVYEVDEDKLEGVKFRKNRPLTKAAYYRILLPEIIDNSIDKIFYIDCDVVVMGDVEELFNIDLDGYALAACEDASPYTSLHRNQLNFSMGDRAFCSGVMMINLKFWRETEAVEKLLEYSKRDRKVVYLHDQDSLNYVFKGKWFKLPYKWGKTPLSIAILDPDQRHFDQDEFVYSPSLIHYASPLKPWNDVWFPERKYYRDYLKLSGFKNVVIGHVDAKKRISYQISVARYYLNRYIRPFVPKIIEILLSDIANIIKIILSLLRGGKGLGRVLLNIWMSRYK